MLNVISSLPNPTLIIPNIKKRIKMGLQLPHIKMSKNQNKKVKIDS